LDICPSVARFTVQSGTWWHSDV